LCGEKEGNSPPLFGEYFENEIKIKQHTKNKTLPLGGVFCAIWRFLYILLDFTVLLSFFSRMFAKNF
jgi:hypothetical protein